MNTIQKFGIAVGVGALFSAGTTISAGFCALANKVHYLSLIKISLPMAITGGISAMFVAGVYQADCREDVKLLAAIAGIVATIWISPHLAQHFSVHRLSYLETAVLILPGLGTIGSIASGYPFVRDGLVSLKDRIQHND